MPSYEGQYTSTPSPKMGMSSLTLNAGHTPHPGSNQSLDEVDALVVATTTRKANIVGN